MAFEIVVIMVVVFLVFAGGSILWHYFIADEETTERVRRQGETLPLFHTNQHLGEASNLTQTDWFGRLFQTNQNRGGTSSPIQTDFFGRLLIFGAERRDPFGNTYYATNMEHESLFPPTPVPPTPGLFSQDDDA